MEFFSRRWFPVGVVLSGLNLVAAGYYARMGGGLHPIIHLVLAAGFAFWAVRIRDRTRSTAASDLPAHLDSVEDQLAELRHEMIETQERLDFAERMLAQRTEAQRDTVNRGGKPGPE